MNIKHKIAKTIRETPRSGIRDFFDLVSQRDDVISLGVGEPDFVTPWRVRESSIYSLEHGSTSYTANLGLLSLRKSISKYVHNQNGVTYDSKKEIIVTVGVSEALDLAIRALIEPGDEVLYHEPCYVSYLPLIMFAGGTPIAVETPKESGFKLTREMLEAKLTPKTKVLMLNYPNNPTGATLTREELLPIAAFVIENDLILISDEVYGELTYDRKHDSIISIDGMAERTIYLHGFSKAWAMTGFRLGWACAPEPIIEAMMKIHQYTMLCASITSQKAGIEALENADSDVAHMRDEYNKRRKLMHHAFCEMGLPCHKPEGAFYMMPDISEFGMSSKEFAMKLLNTESVAVVPGNAFGESGESCIRCCYATSMDEIKIAMTRIANFITQLRAQT